MLLILISLALWIPAVLGWGAWWAVLRPSLGRASAAIDSLELIAGLATLAALALSVNLVYPIRGRVALIALALGWVFALARLRRAALPRPIWSWALLSLCWLVLAAVVANHEPLPFDTGLYHLQALAWARTSPLPFGLANLHGRLGFNTAWFPLAALLELPLGPSRLGTSAHLLNPLVLWCFGLAGLAGLHRALAGRASRSALLLAAALIVPFTNLHFWTISSLAPDFPVWLLTLLCIALTLQGLDRERPITEALAALLIAALLALTIKLSALPLLLFPAALAVWARREGLPVYWRRLARLAGPAALLLLPWLLRGLVSSGCLAYPAAATCLPVPWRVPPAAVQNEAGWVIVYGRWPQGDFDQVRSSLVWLGPWWEKMRAAPEITVPALLALLGLVGLVRSRPRPMWPALLPLLLGLAYWFATSPNIRFGSGWVWGLALLLVAAALHRLRGLSRAALAAALVLTLARDVRQAGQHLSRSVDRRGGWEVYWSEWPPVRGYDAAPQQTVDGHTVLVANGDGRCGLAPPPCAPALRYNLHVVGDPPRMFYVP